MKRFVVSFAVKRVAAGAMGCLIMSVAGGQNVAPPEICVCPEESDVPSENVEGQQVPPWPGRLDDTLWMVKAPHPEYVARPVNLDLEGVELQEGKRYAVVNLAMAYLREAPDYTSELGSQSLMGTIVEIVGEEGYWRNVVASDPYVAWCTNLGLVEMDIERLDAYRATPKYMCVAWHSCVYSEPSLSALRLSSLVEGDVLRQVPEGADGDVLRHELKGADRANGGQISPQPDFVTVMLPDGRTGYVPSGDVQDYQDWLETRHLAPENIIAEALKFRGVPYLWGGASPSGVDCSGLVRHTYIMNGIALPRNASQQIFTGTIVPMNPDMSFGPAPAPTTPGAPAAVDDADGTYAAQLRAEMERRIANLQPADLVFFGYIKDDGQPKITHVGIYIGDGRIIHASHVVRINSLLPGEADYYENSHRLLAARRILPGNE